MPLSHYLVLKRAPEPAGPWRIGNEPPLLGSFEDVENQTEENLYAQAASKLPSLTIEEMRIVKADLKRGTYYRRMARPQYMGGNWYIGGAAIGPFFNNVENACLSLPHDCETVSSSLNQLAILKNELIDVFRVVEPRAENLAVFGHRIRNLLLLASMEFENECKGVMRENGYVCPDNRWTTRDFCKISSKLRLGEYTVSLPFYPALGSRAPFANWEASSPTQSLRWYEAYNSAKHERSLSVRKATIDAAVDAVCAVCVMLAAQYRIIQTWRDQLGEFFHFASSPEWKIEENCFPPVSANAWVPAECEF